MKLAVIYLRDKWRALALAAVLALAFAAVFALYRLPMEAFMYALTLCLGVGAAWAAADFMRWRGRHLRLRTCLKNIDIALDDWPEPATLLEADARDIARALFNRASSEAAEYARQRTDMTEYYTLWTHQAKTPIAAMRLMAQESDGELARAMKPELIRVEQYVDMALNYARLGGEGSDFVIQSADVGAVVKQAVRRLAPLFIRKKLSVDVGRIDARVVTDAKWLEFAVEQVLSNAVKYTSAGGVKIDFDECGLLSVRDTGIGIAPEDLPRVFERGYTGINGRSDRRATGIGLYLARRALRQLGHEIWIESEVGKGTSVYIDLRTRPLDARD